jgi:hypothetical protein
MRRKVFLSLFSWLLVIVFLAFGCNKINDPVPAENTATATVAVNTATATATPAISGTATITKTHTITATATIVLTAVVLPMPSTLDNFEDADLINLLGGTWTLHADSEAGGSSSIISSGIINGGQSSAFAIGVTANVVTALDENLNGYTGLGGTQSNKSGYIILRAGLYPGGCSPGSNDGFDIYYSGLGISGAQAYFGMILSNSEGQYITAVDIVSGSSFSGSWGYGNFHIGSGSFSLPAGATYTVNDVLSRFTAVDFVLRISGTQGASYPVSLFIDSMRFLAP